MADYYRSPCLTYSVGHTAIKLSITWKGEEAWFQSSGSRTQFPVILAA